VLLQTEMRTFFRRYFTHNRYVSATATPLEALQLHAESGVDLRSLYIDMRPYMNRSPFTVRRDCSASRAHQVSQDDPTEFITCSQTPAACVPDVSIRSQLGLEILHVVFEATMAIVRLLVHCCQWPGHQFLACGLLVLLSLQYAPKCRAVVAVRTGYLAFCRLTSSSQSDVGMHLCVFAAAHASSAAPPAGVCAAWLAPLDCG